METPEIYTRERTEKLLAGQREILEQIARGGPLRQVLGEIARYSESCTPTMLASILRYEPSTGVLRRGGHARLPDSFADAVDGLTPGPLAGSCGTAAFYRRRTVSIDVQTDPLWVAFRDFAAQHGIRSAWSTPLLSAADGRLLGVFGMYYPVVREPSADDIALVDHFTHLAALAIERHMHEAALVESERLRHRGLTALVAGLAHELNSPLGVVKLAGGMALDEVRPLPADIADRLQPALDLVVENVERALGLVQAFRSSLVDPGEMQAEPVALAAEVRGTVAALTPRLRDARVNVVVETGGDDTLTVHGDRIRISQFVTNLIENAARHAYGPEGGEVVIRIETSALHPDTTALVVQDHGLGMDAETLARCTEPFFTTARARGNSGLGLFLVRHVVEGELSGRILIESKPGHGTRVTVLLPRWHARVVANHDRP